jgi:hypothetical protein
VPSVGFIDAECAWSADHPSVERPVRRSPGGGNYRLFSRRVWIRTATDSGTA